MRNEQNRAAEGGPLKRRVRPLNPEREPVDYAGWLADKLHAGGDYCKEAATALVRQAETIERLRAELAIAHQTVDVLHGWPDRAPSVPTEQPRCTCLTGQLGPDYCEVHAA